MTAAEITITKDQAAALLKMLHHTAWAMSSDAPKYVQKAFNGVLDSATVEALIPIMREASALSVADILARF